MAAAAALEAAEPGRAARVAARWGAEMRKRQATATPAPPPTLSLPAPPRRSSTNQPDHPPHPATLLPPEFTKPWKYYFALEELKEAEEREAAEPGCHGHEIERGRRWCEAIRANEDSDDTDDDYRPPSERKRARQRKGEEELMGWESETPFPNNNSAADYIDVDDILN